MIKYHQIYEIRSSKRKKLIKNKDNSRYKKEYLNINFYA